MSLGKYIVSDILKDYSSFSSGSCLTVKMKAWHNILEDLNLQHCCENLKFYVRLCCSVTH